MTWILVCIYIIAAISSAMLLVILDKQNQGYVTDKMFDCDIVAGFFWPVTWPLALLLFLYDKFSEWILRKINGGE